MKDIISRILREDITKIGGTKKAEYIRSLEMFENIIKGGKHGKNNLYYALALFYDSGYGSEDLKAMMDILDPRNK